MVNVEYLEQQGWAGNKRGMSFFIVNGGGITNEEIELAKPDATEAKSIAVHVRKCALRYTVFTKRQAAQGQDIVSIKYMLLILIAAFIITSPQLHDFYLWMIKSL